MFSSAEMQTRIEDQAFPPVRIVQATSVAFSQHPPGKFLPLSPLDIGETQPKHTSDACVLLRRHLHGGSDVEDQASHLAI
jgi:hypothetical protein